MAAQGSDWSESGSHRGLSRADQVALALDGATPLATQRAVKAHRLALHYDRAAFGLTLERLRRWSPRAITAVSSTLSPASRLLQTMEIPHVVVDSLLNAPRESSIVVLGCQNPESVPPDAVHRAMARGVTLVTSDKSALLEPLRDALRPAPARPSRVARVRRVDLTYDDIPFDPPSDEPSISELYPGVLLPPGHVPVFPEKRPGLPIDILAVDSLTAEPIVVRVRISRGTLIHAVPHWWQQHGVDRTVMDRRRLVDVPAFGDAEHVVGDITLGEFQAARTMIGALIRALRPTLE